MSADSSPVQFVNLPELDLRGSQPSEEKNPGQHYKSRGAPSASKRQRILRQNTPLSDSYNSPRSSRLSTPSLNTGSFESGEYTTDLGEAGVRSTEEKSSWEIRGKSRYDAIIDTSKRFDGKSPYLYTPPSTNSECSFKFSSTYDTHSDASPAQNTSSPRSNVDDDIDEIDNADVAGNGRHLRSLGSNALINTTIHYPKSIELCDESPRTPQGWNDQSLTLEDSSLRRDDDVWTISPATHQGHLYWVRAATTRTDGSQVPVIDIDAATCPNFLDQLTSGLTTEPVSYIAKDQPTQVAGRGHLIAPENAPLINSAEHEMLIVGKARKVPCATLESQSIAESKIPSRAIPASESEVTGTERTASHCSLDVYLKKGSIEDWSLDIPDCLQSPETVDAESPSTSILLATAEEDLEERISRALSNNPTLAQAYLVKLKDELPYLLPLFCEEEESSPFEDSQFYSYSGNERGATRKAASSSAPSTTGSKSITGGSITTPATSADSVKEGFAEEEEDDRLPNRKRPRREQRRSDERRPGHQERRRLRCHFQAKCPATHCQKICIMNGWLSIHNLRGHYAVHHTVIRCNKCFTKFDKKTEKNQHQRACNASGPPPSVEVIDCDKTDEIEEVLSTFRTWRLDDEEDEEMKNWIIKNKAEFVNNTMPTDEAHDSRELAKWYRIWRTLFPSFQTPVPSPFQDASISPGDLKLERWLTMLQKLVESQVEQKQPPPADIPKQIDYYKEAFRTIHRIALAQSASSSASNLESSQLTDGRSVSTSAFSTANTTPNRPNSDDSRPSTNLHNDEPKNRASKLTNSAGLIVSSQLPLPPCSFGASSSAAAARSPCSTETRGAYGESPVIIGPEQSQRLSTNKEATITSPSHKRALELQPLHQSTSQNTTSLTQIDIGVPQVSQITSGTMMPPPPRNRRPPGAPSQILGQHPMQSYQTQSLPFSLDSMAPGFASNDATSPFGFSDMFEGQGDQEWHNVQLSGGQVDTCRYCMNSGYVVTTSGTEICLSCNSNYIQS